MAQSRGRPLAWDESPAEVCFRAALSIVILGGCTAMVAWPGQAHVPLEHLPVGFFTGLLFLQPGALRDLAAHVRKG